MIEKKYITHQREPFFKIAKNLIQKDSKVLDVGPGNGSFSKFCERDDFYLLEGNPETVEYLKKNYPNVILGRIPSIPFEDGFFDHIHCSHIVEHLKPEELYDFLLEINRTLRPGGHLVISAPTFWSGFYNDLSHIKPYNPEIFIKYLCSVPKKNYTRPSVSTQFELVDLKYRFQNNLERFNLINLKPANILNRIAISIFYRLNKNGLVMLEKTGFTLALRKNP